MHSSTAAVEPSTGCGRSTEEAAINASAGWRVERALGRRWGLGLKDELELVS